MAMPDNLAAQRASNGDERQEDGLRTDMICRSSGHVVHVEDTKENGW